MAADPAEPTSLRLFAAVDVPERAGEAIDRAIAPWRERLGGGRWVPPGNRHITVRFLGRTSAEAVDRVSAGCAEAAARIRPFGVALEGLGVFPSPGRARVLWVGIRDREGGLSALARAVDAALADVFPPERRPFSPHLTVARFAPFVDARAVIEALRATEIGARFRVSRLVLYRSHLSPKGARYEPLGTFPLTG